jgi:hypothetical protein
VDIPDEEKTEQPKPQQAQAQQEEKPQTIAEEIKEREAQELEKTIAKNPYVIDEAELPPFPAAYGDYEEYRKAVDKWRETHPNDSALEPYCDNAVWWSTGDYADQIDKSKRFDVTIAKLNKEHPLLEHNMQKVRVGTYDAMDIFLNDRQRARMEKGGASAQFWQNTDTREAVIGFNPFGVKGTLADDLRIRANALKEGKTLLSVLDNSPEGYAIHEWGHGMSDYISMAMVYDCPDAHDYWAWYKSLSKEEIKEGLSHYATHNRGEFEAECFAELQTDNPRPLALQYEKYLKKCRAYCRKIKFIDSTPD